MKENVCLVGNGICCVHFDKKILVKINLFIIPRLACSSNLHSRGCDVICPSLNFLAFPKITESSLIVV